MQIPFFTVVIPTYNRSNLLKRAIVSVLEQTFANFELIIVDDQSTDDTASVVNSFGDSRIRYMMNHRTKGACGARNVGIFSATGKWVAFLDDDDIWLPEKLKDQYELIQDVEETVGLVCSDYAILKSKDQKPLVVKNRPSGWVMDKVLSGGYIGSLSSVCVRADVLHLIDGFDERFPSSQDQDLWLRVAEIAQFAHVPKPHVYMLQDNRDRIGRNAQSKLDGYIMLRNKYLPLINKSLRIRNHYESRIFMYALIQSDLSQASKCMPWFLIGIIVNFTDFLRTLYATAILIYRRKHCPLKV